MKVAGWASLEQTLRGELVLPGHPAYDEARALWNAMIDKRPGAIARCASVQDVISAIAHARDHGLKIAIRGGGHSAPGHSSCDHGLVVDLSRMRGVRIDPALRIAWVQGGCLLQDMDRAARQYGLATPAGAVSHTGVAGLTLGGGLGHIMRRYGLTIDSLLGAEVVTADARVRWVDDTQEPELFWALRGGGGNFGVVTEFKFRLHPVPDPYIAIMVHPLQQAPAVIDRWRHVMSDSAPDELMWAGFFRWLNGMAGVPEAFFDQPMLVSAIEWHGENGQGAAVIDPLIDKLQPSLKIVGPMSYLHMQSMNDELTRAGNMAYSKAGFFGELSDALIVALLEHGRRIISPRSFIEVITMGGAVRRVDSEATAFPHRTANYVFNVVGLWHPQQDRQANLQWVREAYADLEGFGTSGAYVNYMGGEETGGVKAAYGQGATLSRLRRVKAQYDPRNLFCFGYDLS